MKTRMHKYSLIGKVIFEVGNRTMPYVLNTKQFQLTKKKILNNWENSLCLVFIPTIKILRKIIIILT